MLPRLYAIVDEASAGACGMTVVQLARAFLDAGVRLIQVRGKQMGARDLLRTVRDLAPEAAAVDGRLIVNDRADVARLVAGCGVHVGQDDLPPAFARQIVGAGPIVGFSTHTISQVDQALSEPISYLAVGPVFGTRTKDTGYGAVGLDLVRYAAAAAARRGRAADTPPLPVVAIGGITLENAALVIENGATSVAVISDLLAAGDPGARARAYLSALHRAGSGSRAQAPK